ncbi:hypothetical protein MMC25_003309 [Agyrium rufum]|nr:hypothetical protein [Agyrium rufum]
MSSPKPSPFSFTLRTPTAQDIPALAQTAADSFATDANSQLKNLRAHPNHIVDMMRDVLNDWVFADPKKCVVLKAVDDSTGTSVGWVCWGFKGFDIPSATCDATTPRPAEDTQKQEVEEAEKSKTEASVSKEGSGDAASVTTGEADRENDDKYDDNIKRLDELTNDHMSEWMAHIMPEGTKCMFLYSIAINPAYQKRGIGSVLIRWGTEKADEAGVFCWVHSSDGGYGAFEANGYVERQRLVVNLDEYAGGVKRPGVEGDGKWGEYVFRYMVREPRR